MVQESENNSEPSARNHPPEVELVILPQSLPENSQPQDDYNHKRPNIDNLHVQLAALYYSVFLLGFQDGALGPLLPMIQRTYHVNFLDVSLIYVFSCIGMLLGALMNIQPGEKFGFGKLILIGAVFQLCGYSMLAPAPPFSVIILAYTVIGFGEAIQNVQANAFVAALGSNNKLGILHASYGTGALISPLIATRFSQLPRWSFHWLVALVLAAVNVALLGYVFRLRKKKSDSDLVDEPISTRSGEISGSSKWRDILRIKSVHALAIFLLVYCGIEVTLGGWIVTFMIEKRHASSNAGYVSAGFFGGLMLGRLALLWVNKKVGTRRVIFIYAILALSLEFSIWFIPSLVGNAVAVSLVGFVMGPMYPLVINHAHVILPPQLLAGSLGWIVGVGTTGVASLPFITGALADKFGVGSLQPFVAAMMCTLILLWAVTPHVQRRMD